MEDILALSLFIADRMQQKDRREHSNPRRSEEEKWWGRRGRAEQTADVKGSVASGRAGMKFLMHYLWFRVLDKGSRILDWHIKEDHFWNVLLQKTIWLSAELFVADVIQIKTKKKEKQRKHAFYWRDCSDVPKHAATFWRTEVQIRKKEGYC